MIYAGNDVIQATPNWRAINKSTAKVIIDQKGGETGGFAHERMQNYYSACQRGDVTCTRYLPNEDLWVATSPSRGAFLTECDLFYKKIDWRLDQSKHEQKIINTIRQIAKELQSDDVECIVHHGHPDDNRTNPAPWEKGIDEKFYALSMKVIRKKLTRVIDNIVSENRKIKVVKREIEERKDELNKLTLEYSQQQKELLAIKI